MTSARWSILIDARVNGKLGAHGLARSVLKLTEHMGRSRDGLALRILVNRSVPQLFPLAGVADRAELIDTDIRPGAVHHSRELGQLIRDVGAAVFYAPYPLFAPLICPCPMVVTIHDCIFESSARDAGGLHRQLGLKAATATILRRAAAVTAPTRASLAEIRRHYPAAPNPTLIPNGIDASQFTGVTDRAVAAVPPAGAVHPHRRCAPAAQESRPTASRISGDAADGIARHRGQFRPKIPGLASAADFPAWAGFAG
jgi:glycosyltransferase involved in cell wall biosynthesis